MPFAEINDTRINYVQIDCESGDNCEDLVMIHGLATNLACWFLPYVPTFSKRYRITLYDLRGHGRSSITNSGYTPKNMAVDLQQLLDHLCIERAHFVTHSFGGVVALNMACIYPDRFASLVLADTHISTVRRLQKTIKWEFGEKIQQILDQHDMDIDVREPYFGLRLLNLMAHLKIHNSDISQEFKDLVSPLMGVNGNRTAKKWLNLMKISQAEKELMSDDGLSLDNLRKLNFPILAMYGELSQAMSTGKHLLEVWPYAEFRSIREAGHFFLFTRHSEFIENCLRFLDSEQIKEPYCRIGDSTIIRRRYFRNNRYYIRKGKWYYDSRESKRVGPFDNLYEAKEHLMRRLCLG